jgi:hypothetical protein
MNQTAKYIQRVLMIIASLLNALLPILHVSKFSIPQEFILGVNLVCSVLLALACKPIVELSAELVESVNNLVNTVSAQNSSRTEGVNTIASVDIPISPDAPKNSEPIAETGDDNIIQMNAYYNSETHDVSITPRL